MMHMVNVCVRVCVCVCVVCGCVCVCVCAREGFVRINNSNRFYAWS